jgi:hypothetical protein
MCDNDFRPAISQLCGNGGDVGPRRPLIDSGQSEIDCDVPTLNPSELSQGILEHVVKWNSY